MKSVKDLEEKKFDLVMLIEGFQSLSRPEHVLKYVCDHMLYEKGQLVIADVFEKSTLEKVENRFAELGFAISKKEVITFNVKHAMQLDKPRIEKMIT